MPNKAPKQRGAGASEVTRFGRELEAPRRGHSCGTLGIRPLGRRRGALRAAGRSARPTRAVSVGLEVGQKGCEDVVQAAIPLVPVVPAGGFVELAGEPVFAEKCGELAIRWEEAFLIAAG